MILTEKWTILRTTTPRPTSALELSLKKCNKSGAIVWKEERVKGGRTKEARYVACCGDGPIILPHLREAPERLRNLMNPSATDPMARRFKQHIRSFNSMYAITSHEAKVSYSGWKRTLHF